MSNKNKLTVKDELTEFLLYSTPDGKVKVEIFFHDENIWLTQKRIAELFSVQRPAITKHLNNIIKEGELEENSVSSILEHTAEDGKIYKTKHYNLDAIISVGYRVNSSQATKFRIWASERRIYQQITDIFAECSINYDPRSDVTKDFYTTIQNKFHFAISGFFDYIENIIENRISFTMEKFAQSVNNFLSFNEYKVLAGKGSVSHKQAMEKASIEYDKFNKVQKIESDFDHEIKRFLKNNEENT